MSTAEGTTNGAAGEPRTMKSKVLETGAAATQASLNTISTLFRALTLTMFV